MKILGLFLILFLFICVASLGCTNEIYEEGNTDMNPEPTPPKRRFTRSQVSNNLITTPNAVGSFKGNPDTNFQVTNLDPGEYTIQFIPQRPGDGKGFAAYAFINWKVDGQAIPRVISIFDGASISGVCEAVDVRILDQSGRGAIPPPFTGGVVNGSNVVNFNAAITLPDGEQISFASQPNIFYQIDQGIVNATVANLKTPYTGATNAATSVTVQGAYKIVATLSRGTRATTMQPPVLVTSTGDVVASGGSANEAIPQNVGIISVLVAVIVFGNHPQAEIENGIAQFIDANNNILLSFVPSETGGSWVPVPPGAVTLQFVNQSTTQSLQFTFQWGIEG